MLWFVSCDPLPRENWDWLCDKWPSIRNLSKFSTLLTLLRWKRKIVHSEIFILFVCHVNFRVWFFISSKMARSGVDETSESGAFVRTASTFRNFVSQDPDSQFPAESGRYHLYISYACPWACRCLSYLKIKGLDEAISFSVSTTKPILYLTDFHI